MSADAKILNAVTTLAVEGDVAIVTLNSPPVNALSAPVREGLTLGINAALADSAVKSVVLICDGRTFIAGADITEFGKAPVGPSLQDVQNTIENASKPVVAAIHGTALGGGLEVALTCHYRVAVPSAKCGLPEVNLGLLPGAGGTQRLPRIVGAAKALEMMTTGQHVGAKACLAMGLVDDLAEEGKLRETAVAFAKKIVAEGRPLKRVRDLEDKVLADRANPGLFAEFRKANARKFRGFMAPESNIKCIEAAVNLPFDEGVCMAIDAGIPVIAGSRLPSGAPHPGKGYPGSWQSLVRKGAISSGYLSGIKARILLMVALGETKDPGRLREIFRIAGGC
jgi:3-hydroxyacyl-CoA dehydrogenase